MFDSGYHKSALISTAQYSSAALPPLKPPSGGATMSVGRLLRRAGVSSRFHVLVLLAMAVFIVVVVHQVHNMDASSSSAAHTSHLERHLSASSDTDPEAAAAVAAPPGDTLVYYKKDIPLIWIGGVPRSGTTLMRAMLDAHRDVRCGEETRVIPRILGMHTGMQKSQVEMARLLEAHIDENVLNQALASYILSIIAQHGEAAPRLCNKDPFTLRSMTRLMKMFPQSKFILMIRDGRATAHSIISRHVTIKGFDIKSYRGAIKDWNRAISGMYSECSKHGPETCLPVHYEQLVLHPEREMRRILTFLDIAWDPMVIHHEQAIGKGISLSKKELSTDQVDKPINTKALTSWVDHIPEDVRRDMEVIAPMLRTLGYDPNAYPPNYGTPDKQVADNSARLAQDVGAAAGAVQPDPLPIHGGANYGPPDHKH